jgi:Transposase domain (DUF772)
MAVRSYQQTPMWGWLVQQLLDPTHDLLILARQIDWEAISEALRPYYHRLGRYAKPIRLMVGLHLLKHRLHLSDARVVQGLHENLYWMTFCGIDAGAVMEQATPACAVAGGFDDDHMAPAPGTGGHARLGSSAPAAVGARKGPR